jgi:hypothetical protein
MNKFLSFALLATGVTLILFGVSTADSLASGLARLFTGSPTEKTTWFIVIGLFSFAAGFAGVLRGSKT